MKLRDILFLCSFFISAAAAFSIPGGDGKPGEHREDGSFDEGKQMEMDGRRLSEQAEGQAQTQRAAGMTMAADPTINSHFDQQEGLSRNANLLDHGIALVRVIQKSLAIKKNEEEFLAAQKAVKTAGKKYADTLDYAQVAPRKPGELTQLHSDVLEAGKRVEEAAEKLNEQEMTGVQCYEAIPLKNQISTSGQMIIYGDSNHNLLDQKETAPLHYSFTFGVPLCSEITEREEKDFVKLLQKQKTPFDEMSRDLMRATFETADQIGATISYLVEPTSLDDTAQERLDQIMSLIGDNNYLRIAIANLMYQKGVSTLEQITAGVSYDNIASQEIWGPEIMGSIYMQLADGERYPKTEHPSYHLDKTMNDGESIFILTLKNIRTNQLDHINHHIAQFLTFEFSENKNFREAQPISQRNAPVIIRCRNGGIVRSFDDQRTSEQKNFQEAEYNYAVASNKEGISAHELDFAKRWRDVKKAEYDLSIAQQEYGQTTTNPLERLQDLSAKVKSVADAGRAVHEGFMTATGTDVQNAAAALKAAQDKLHELVPSIED